MRIRTWHCCLFAGFGFVLLPALIVPRVIGHGEHRDLSGETQSEMANIKNMLLNFELDCGRFPTTAEGLRALRVAPSGLEKKWGPTAYSDIDIVNDRFGNPYVYRSSGRFFELRSFGQDGKPGGEGQNADLSVFY